MGARAPQCSRTQNKMRDIDTHMETTRLSYVLSTRNKLPYLKTVLPDLMERKQADEEIVVADGASEDGTLAYLEGLEHVGAISLVRGPDVGEAHGFNKGIMASRGELVKLITDDDAFYFDGIHACKEFMLAHPEIDLLATDGIKRRKNAMHPFSPMRYQSRFDKQQHNHEPFAFCGLGIMIRKSSLPILGLLNANFVRTDAEYSLRVTASRARLAWYAHECFAHIRNERSNSVVQERKVTEEMELLEALYLGVAPRPSALKHLRAFARHVRNWLRTRTAHSAPEAEELIEQWRDMYRTSVAWLEENGARNRGTFLH